MSASASIVDRGAFGDLFTRVVDVTLDNAYQAGGYALTARDLGFGTNGTVLAVYGTISKTGGWLVGYDYTNAKLQVFDGSGGASVVMHEIATNTSLTGVVVRLLVLGKGQG